MSQTLGIVTAAIQLGVQAVLVKPKRQIGGFTAQVTLREVHTDELEITDQPVERGAQISDHSFKRPAEVVIEAVWSNSPSGGGFLGGVLGAAGATVAGVASILTGNSLDQIRDVYQRLLALQESRERFDVYTGKRVYRDMLIKTLITETDKETENLLRVTVTCRQILIATVQLASVGAPPSAQADPQSTMPSIDKGVKQLTTGVKANLSSMVDALTPSGLGSVGGGIL